MKKPLFVAGVFFAPCFFTFAQGVGARAETLPQLDAAARNLEVLISNRLTKPACTVSG
jgi:hypothetical protein